MCSFRDLRCNPRVLCVHGGAVGRAMEEETMNDVVGHFFKDAPDDKPGVVCSDCSPCDTGCGRFDILRSQVEDGEYDNVCRECNGPVILKGENSEA